MNTTKEAFLIESLKVLVDGIARTFGSHCEVVLHDLSKGYEHSIVKIVNGHVTGRTVGGSITDQGLKHLRSQHWDNILANYLTVTNDGRRLKSSTIKFTNSENEPIAALCINFDVTDILNFNSAVQDVFAIPDSISPDDPVETFQSDMASTLNDIADRIVRKAGKAIPSMKRKDKIEIVNQLEHQGFFLIKGAVKLLARKLDVSKFTIYNYLEQIRAENQGKDGG